jgi:hypothetical protein
MSDPDIHLKLDRILAGQSQIFARVGEHDETTRVLISAMSVMREAVTERSTPSWRRLSAPWRRNWTGREPRRCGDYRSGGRRSTPRRISRSRKFDTR